MLFSCMISEIIQFVSIRSLEWFSTPQLHIFTQKKLHPYLKDYVMMCRPADILLVYLNSMF